MTGVDLISISSPTHATAVRPTDKSFEIFLPTNSSAPDRDFVLRWRRAARPALLSAAWISADQDATYALARLGAQDQVPESREGKDIYFSLIVPEAWPERNGPRERDERERLKKHVTDTMGRL
jgi:hypothetical protein